MEDKKSFGEYLRTKRTQMGLTQKSFASQLFVTESAVSKWERGLSYPDITLIGDMCRLLGITEHELLTASEDIEARGRDKLAQRYLRLIQRVRLVQYLVYGIPLLVCLICNIAVSHKLSWFYIVLAAELVSASLTLLPVLVEEKRGLITLGGFVSTLLLLLLVCCLYTGGSWFIIAAVSVLFGMAVIFAPYVLRSIWLPEPLIRHKALLCFCADTALLFLLLLVSDLRAQGGAFLPYMCPIAAFCLTLPWGMLLIIRYTRINRFFKTAACLGWTGVFHYLSYGVIDSILGIQPARFGFRYAMSTWEMNELNVRIMMIISLSLAGLAVAFAVAGIVYELLAARKQQAGQA